MSSFVQAEAPADRPALARRGAVGRLARWATRHRRSVIAAWLLLVAAGFAVSAIAGNKFDNALSMPGSDSQQATDLLRQNLAAQSGDVDQIVFTTQAGRVDAASVRASVQPMLDRVARIPHVSSVVSPYGPAGAAHSISRDGRTAFATVVFDEAGEDLPPSVIQRVVDVAGTARSPQLGVELGGDAIEQFNRPSVGPATAIGVLAAMVILFLTFGSLVAVSLPIAAALAGLGVSTGLIAIATHLVTVPDFAQQIAMMIGLGVGVDYALLVVTRYRETYRRNGGDVQDAIEVAMDTAGRSVIFASLTVVISLSGLYAVGVNLLSGVAIAASATVLFVLAGSMTLLPALMSYAGPRIARGRARRGRPQSGGQGGGRLSRRWISTVQRRPLVAAAAAAVALLALAAPVLDLRLAFNGAAADQASSTTRKAYDQLSEAFGPGFNGPFVIAVRFSGGDQPALVDRLTSQLRQTPGVAAVGNAELGRAHDTAAIMVTPAAAPSSEQVKDLVHRLRDEAIPAALAGSGAQAHVGGYTPASVDFTQRLSDKLPLFIGIVIGLAALLLLLVFRSLLIPLQGAVMNLLSIGAALGILQAVFERGWLAGPLNVQQSVIEPFMPVIIFAIVFGLSMDYEVFLVSRIHEEWARSGDPAAAIRQGLASTARVITAAAAIMITVFASFALSGDHVLQLFGLGLASAIFLDALVIRMALLPATLALLGRATWWLPAWLGRMLPRLTVEASEPAAPAALERT
jgi:putative drug exporter of the RND superfamily